MMYPFASAIRISPYVDDAFRSSGLKLGAYIWFFKQLSMLSRQSLVECNTDGSFFEISHSKLASTLNDSYNKFYDKYVQDMGCSNIQSVIDKIGFNKTLKLDIFYKIAPVNGNLTVFLIINALPSTVDYIPHFGIRYGGAYASAPATLN